MKSSLFKGRYFFHFHTQATDGHLSVEDYFDFALHRHIQTLVFLEHIRRHPTYDVDAFLDQIAYANRHTRVSAVVGFEAKVLPDGSIDIDDRHLALAAVVGLAEHSAPSNAKGAESALRRALSTYPRSFPSKTFVWVHPGLWFRRFTSTLALYPPYLALLRIAQENGVLIERNLRYGLAHHAVIAKLNPELLVTGADAHSSRDLQVWLSAMAVFATM